MGKPSSHGESRDSMLKRLACVEGQIRGVQRLIKEDADCEKVAQQMTAARRALEKAYHEMVGCLIEDEIFDQKANALSTVEAMTNIRSIINKYS
jgi:DNA-binding FrmR family transcriptional regulator